MIICHSEPKITGNILNACTYMPKSNSVKLRNTNAPKGKYIQGKNKHLLILNIQVNENMFILSLINVFTRIVQ